MYCVALTGNIASGKTTIATFFKSRGITVICADEVARELTQKNQPALKVIQQHFGDYIINSSGELIRSKLREIIFTFQKERLWLEELLHPLIRKRIAQLLDLSTSTYSVVDIPLLNDRETFPYLDRILVVIADLEKQIRRVMSRDKCSFKHAQAILASQPSPINRKKLADDIVINNGTLLDLENKIEEYHQLYLRLAKEKNS